VEEVGAGADDTVLDAVLDAKLDAVLVTVDEAAEAVVSSGRDIPGCSTGISCLIKLS
jgi:hypothetical protein